MRSYSRSEDHVGEWLLTLWADTPEELFQEAARVISREGGSGGGAPGEWEPISLAARDTATLLVDWLNELLGRSEVARRRYRDVRIRSLADGRLDAEVRGYPVARWRSALKAATYHGLELTQEGGRWKARVLFDI
jgi:SHS2 domain-containing protein